MRLVVCLFLGVFCMGFTPGLGDVDDLTELLSLGGDIVEKIFNTWVIVSPDGDRSVDEDGGPGEYLGPEFSFTRRKERKLLSRMNEIANLVSRVEQAVQSSIAATVDALMSNLPDVVKFELRLDHLTEYMAQNSEQILSDYIKLGYDNTSRHDGSTSAQQSAWRLEKHTLLDFAQNAVAHGGSSVRGLMSKINSLVAPQNGPFRRSIFELLKKSLEQQGSAVQCSAKQSPHQLLMNVFSSVQLVQLRGFAVMQFSWMLLRLYEKGNFSLEAKIAAYHFKKNQDSQVAVIRSVLKGAPRFLWHCDPDKHIEGKSYEQVTRLLQGFLVNEVDLNREGTCHENCAYYSYAETQGCYQDQYCAQQPACNGRLLNCQFFDSDMWVCPSESNRRYDWIEYENGKILGKKGYCGRGTTKVDSWWRYVFWHCSYCMCLCDEEGPKSDRFFSLRPALSDIKNNKVVTGVRIIKHNRIFYIQIEEGEVLKNGVLNGTTLDWKPIDSFLLHGGQVQEGNDYMKLDWQQRAVNLDDLIARSGHVLTGLRFRDLGGHLSLVIRSTPIDISTGKLRPDASIWIDNDNDNTVTPRKELKLVKPDVPTRSLAPAMPDSDSNTFLKFTSSDMEADAAQTTIPFIDIQALVTNPPVLLSGAGLFHKGQPNYGGFIALKIFTFDYSDFIAPMSPVSDINSLRQDYLTK